MQQKRVSITKPTAPAIKIAIFKGSTRRRERKELVVFPQPLVSGSWSCKLLWGVEPKPLTVNNFQLLGHTALGRPHTVGGLTAVHPCVCLGHTLKLLLQTKTRWEFNWREQQLCVCTYVYNCTPGCIEVCVLYVRWFAYLRVYSPVCPSLCRCCMRYLLWPSGPCCLCTSGRWREARWVCPYRAAPGLGPQTQSWAPRRTGHEAALRRQRGERLELQQKVQMDMQN